MRPAHVPSSVRLRVLSAALAVLALVGLAGLIALRAAQANATLARSQVPTSCGTPTPAETEGPYFKAGSPSQADLAATGMPGTRLRLSGTVVDTNCQPIAGALVDFWQADASGQYDNSGYTLRGHQYTDASGHYELETVVPGLYPGRTRHIHVKVQAPGQPELTTQLYFPDESNNARDGVFQDGGPQLLMQVQSSANGLMLATFNFVVALRQ